MTDYVAYGYGGWMMVIRAPHLRAATAYARAVAETASLLPSDIHTVRRATDAEVAHYRAMCGMEESK